MGVRASCISYWNDSGNRKQRQEGPNQIKKNNKILMGILKKEIALEEEWGDLKA